MTTDGGQFTDGLAKVALPEKQLRTWNSGPRVCTEGPHMACLVEHM